MYEVIYMKADFEPWWMFEEWRDYVEQTKRFETKREAATYYRALIEEWSERYEQKETRHVCFTAFWTKGEQCFCDHCDDDLQIFHGLIVLKNGEPLRDDEQLLK